MSGVQFDPLEPGGHGPFDGRHKRLLHHGDLVDAERVRHPPARRERHRTRRDRLPASVGFDNSALRFPGPATAGFSSRMRQLDAGNGAVLLQERGNPRQPLDVSIAPDAEILRTDSAARFDRRRLDDDKRRAADGAAAQMHEMPVGRKTVHGAVLAHRRHADAVPQRDASYGKRIEQMGHGY